MQLLVHCFTKDSHPPFDRPVPNGRSFGSMASLECPPVPIRRARLSDSGTKTQAEARCSSSIFRREAYTPVCRLALGHNWSQYCRCRRRLFRRAAPTTVLWAWCIPKMFFPPRRPSNLRRNNAH